MNSKIYQKPLRSLAFACTLALSQACGATTETAKFDLADSVFDTTSVDPYLLYSIALQESGWAPKRSATNYGPWPFSVRVNSEHPVYGGGHRFDTVEDALAFIEQYKNDGHSIDQLDLGLMQISYRYHKDLINKHGGIEAMFIPSANIKVGASILKVAMNSTKDPVLGVGRYHQWGDVVVSREYAKSVFNIYERLMLLRTGS